MSDRSRSPLPAAAQVHQDRPVKKQKTSKGFTWKEKPANSADIDKERSHEQAHEERHTGRLERGYRNRSPKEAPPLERRPERAALPQDADASSSLPPAPSTKQAKDSTEELPAITPAAEIDKSSVQAKFGANFRPRNPQPPPTTTTTSTQEGPQAAPKTSKPAKPRSSKRPALPANAELITVYVSDRLGTRTSIPCLASDSVKAFKAILAARIGRRPAEILLKRQGERPFRDALTLEDYGVGNGVQLDLELETGD